MLIANPSQPLKALIVLPYLALIIAGLTVPSDGSHGFFNIKSLAYVCTVLSAAGYLLIVKKLSLIEWKMVCFLLASVCFLLIWLMVSLVYAETSEKSSWEQLKIVWLTVSVVAISAYFVYDGLISFQALLKTVLLTNFAYSTVKVSLVVLHCLGYINLWSIVDAMGVRFMSMDILGILPRFQTSIDIVTPFLLFFFLQSKRFGIEWTKTFKVIYLFISVIAIFLSFSRFLTFIALLSFLLHALTLRSSTIIKMIPIVFIFCFSVIYWIGIDDVYTIVERRFFSTDNFNSDLGRREQITALIDESAEYPLFGKGLGGYAPNMIRDTQLLYSYEVQWLASLMQFGIVGISLLLIPLGLISRNLLSRPISREKISCFILFLSWLASGFTNPFLLSLTSGIVYSIFLLAGHQFCNENNLNPRLTQNNI